MTHTELILKELEDATDGLTCQNIVDKLHQNNIGTTYLSGSISSKLNRLVRKGVVIVDPIRKGPLKGNVYRLNKEV